MSTREDCGGCESVFEAKILAELRGIKDDTEQLKRLITGGDTPQDGLVVRVDRMEQVAASEAKARWLFGSAAITSLVAAVWQWLKGGS